jgi:glyoxylase-like metal-dependent hydrolase (beta-lactamase superfamily II)
MDVSRLYYEEYGNGVYCVDVCYQRPRLAASYLIREGEQAAIVETGTANGVDQMLTLMERLDIAPEQVRYVMPTHVHLDHAGGAGRMMGLFPNAQLVIHPFGARHMIDPSKLQAGTIAVYGEEKFREYYGEIEPIPEGRVITAENGFKVDLNGRELVCYDTPGHARHHYCVYDAAAKGFFTGDTFGLGYPELGDDGSAFIMAATTPVQFDPDVWHATLDKLLALDPKFMYLTHFGRVSEVPALAKQLREEIDFHADLARRAPAGEGRKGWLEQQLLDHQLERLRARGCTLAREEIESLIASDMDLNAQGLDVWLQRGVG